MTNPEYNKTIASGAKQALRIEQIFNFKGVSILEKERYLNKRLVLEMHILHIDSDNKTSNM